MNDIKVMNHAADNIRILAASMVEKANSGHPGGAMGGSDFINVLFAEYLVYDPADPTWTGRDRFFLDPGHMSPMLYAETTQSQTSIEHWAHVTWVEEEAVAASPCWISWIINQILREEYVDEVRTTHSTTWVT